jgi:hypothetical protein
MKKWLSAALAKPWVRAQLCATIIGSMLSVGGVAYAKHRARTFALKVGSEVLVNMPDGGTEAVVFNGARFFFDAVVTDKSVDSVLSRAEDLCADEAKDLKDELGPLMHYLAPHLSDASGDMRTSSLLTVRSDKPVEVPNASASDQSSGDVACWVRREGIGKTLVDRAKAFASTFDLSEFGSLQYVHATKQGNKTLVRVIRSQGPLALNDIFPDDGDVPGRELNGVPRPPESDRILSAYIEGQRRDVVGYASPSKPAEIVGFYAEQLAKNGWTEVSLDSDRNPIPGPTLMRAYQRDRHAALLAVSPDSNGKGSSATWVSIPRP